MNQSNNQMAPLSTPCLEDTPYAKATSKRSVVHFDEQVRVRKSINLVEFSDDEISTCWYSNEEFIAMKEKVHITGHQGFFETDDITANNNRWCRRLAEAHASLQARLRRKIKRAVRDAVLEEQWLQWNEGYHDPDFIAYVSSILSARSKASARQIGLEDEWAVAAGL
jgi:hypothetical protein